MLIQILQLIVSTVASILGGVMLLRFWMQVIRVRPPNQVGHVIFTLSDWLVRPLRRIVPGVGGYDWASLIGAILIVALATTVYFLANVSVEWYLMKVLYRVINWMLYGLTALMFVEVIFSWVNPHAPMAPFVRALNEPMLRHLRRVVPQFGGLDWSMLVALLLVQIVRMVIDSQFPLTIVQS